MKRRIACFLLAALMLCGMMSFMSCSDDERLPTPDIPDDGDTQDTPSGSEDDGKEEEPKMPEGNYAESQSVITDYVTVYGRTPVKENALVLYWTNSGFALNFYGTGVSAMLIPSTTNKTYYGYLNVYIDGALSPTATICVDKMGTYALAENLPLGDHTIEVRKRNEATYGESATISVGQLAVTDGMFNCDAPERPEYTIEVIGDSITSGFGNMIADNSGNFTTATQDGTMTYAVLAAKMLGADARVMSRSGMCYVTGSNKDSMYPYYTETAGLPAFSASTEPWDFESNPVDVVVINLGTNDTGATINGSAISGKQYTALARDFLELVRYHNPDATIIWAYGMMTTSRGEYIEAAVKELNDEGDDNIYYFELPTMNTVVDGIGTHAHPSFQTHLKCGTVLAEYIGEVMGWVTDHRVTLAAQSQLANEFWLKSIDKKYSAQSVAQLQAAVDAGAALALTDADNEECLAAVDTIRQAYALLATEEDYSSEYIVLDTCDERGSWSLNGGRVGIDTENHVQGSGCFTTTGSGNINFMNTSGKLSVELPQDWQNWYFEMWIYVDDPTVIPGGCSLEFSKQVDKIEFAYDIRNLNLQSGWNYVQLPLKNAMKAAADQMDTIQNIRLFLISLPSSVTFKVDDIVLSRGKFAQERWDLDDLIEDAEKELPEEGSALAIALERAKQAKSQRQVDNAIETLEELLG